MRPTLAPAPAQQGSTKHVHEMNADNDLRAQLAAVINPPHQHSHLGLPHGAHGYNDLAPSSAGNPSHGHNIIDPAIAGAQQQQQQQQHDPNIGMMDPESGGDDSIGDGRKGGKRELSQSKRAAQNRAAQRAFRQRKEGYIKKLEEQVRELHALEDNYKAIQAENYSLREYIIHLQSRLIESHGEFPQPPANVNLSMEGMHRHEAPTAPMGISAMSQLQASAAQAQAVADLSSVKRHGDEPYMNTGGPSKRYKDASGANDDEELSRQLQANVDGLPPL